MTSTKKGIIFILDGLGDRPSKELNGKTPLEFADTPNLDRLAASGQCGLMDPLLPGLPVDTHTGVGILFGLPPQYATELCRGPIEAAGIGLPMKDGDLLFRANLATVSRNGDRYQINDRRAERINDEVEVLCQSLQDIQVGESIYASLHPATQHRCVLLLRGPGLSNQISDTDPGGKHVFKGIQSCIPLKKNDSSAKTTADAINVFTELSHKVLDKHPLNIKRQSQGKLAGNAVLTRGVGFYQDHTNLIDHLKLKAAVVAGESTILGLSNLFGFTSITEDTFTSLTDTNLELKIRRAKDMLQSHDLVYVHIKGTDTAAHDRDPALKAWFINQFDNAIGKAGLENLVIGVCADHSTDSVRGEHNGDAVPILLQHAESRIDQVRRYNETDCSQGALVRLTAQSFLLTMLDAMGQLGVEV
ncbi:MAG: 2,3-bisphosphoglycerate-independent phosphoglycerate mutase [Gammaproteobacteria bacterium]|nr:2,3-bisphosphoglycerate-independent phosphoglycerate mutase [Gammaproteobacteria bacterium]